MIVDVVYSEILCILQENAGINKATEKLILLRYGVDISKYARSKLVIPEESTDYEAAVMIRNNRLETKENQFVHLLKNDLRSNITHKLRIIVRKAIEKKRARRKPVSRGTIPRLSQRPSLA